MILMSFVSVAAAQSGFGSGSFRNPFDDLYSGSPLLEFHADILDNNRPRMMRDTLIIDFESRQVTFTRIDELTGMSIWSFHYAEMEDFFRDIENHARQSLWNEIVRERGRAARATRGTTDGSGLAFAVPANLPRWATRIMGQEPPKLAITGTQRLLIGAQRNISGTRQHPEKHRPTPEFKPTSNFNIRGTVGRLLTLEINLRGDEQHGYDFFEQARDQLSQVRIHYRESYPGELEDDIIQEVEIGRTSFQMPGHGLAGFSSGSNDNLFGIRIRSRFGPLDITTIASIENVEHQRRSIRSGDPRTDSIFEGGYIRNRFFFLDSLFWAHANNPSAVPNLPTVIAENVHVFRRVSSLPDEPHFGFLDGNDPEEVHTFRRLRQSNDGRDGDYIIHRDRPGVIQFLTHISDHDIIGIIWDSGDPRIPPKGRQNYTTVQTVSPQGDTITSPASNFWTLKPREAIIDTNHVLFDRGRLMMRNVYNIGQSSREDFRLQIFRSVGGELHEQNDSIRFFTDILGLADDRGILKTDNQRIFDLENGFMFIPPFDTRGDASLNPNWVFTNPSLYRNEVPNVNFEIYDDFNRTNPPPAHFRIVTESKRRSERFHLDFGVVENSERIWTQAGDTLQRHIDYSIDYSFGEVVLISPRALAADILEVSYQRESLFLLDRKVFIGVNTILNFPGLGRNSFLSTTLMWQLMDAKRMMPRVGTEPYNRFLFASNLNLDFTPLWMTSLINLIPLIEREAQSSATFNIEVAHSRATSAAGGGGEAFIDNFSTAARTVSLSLSHLNWFRAAPDNAMRADTINGCDVRVQSCNEDDTRNIWRTPPVWHQYWYLPATGDNRAGRNEIYPPDFTTSWGNRVHDERISTMRLVVEPFPQNPDLLRGISEDSTLTGRSLISPFAGITYPLSSHLWNRSEDRYFEFWLRLDRTANPRGRGRLNIDFGIVSTDISLDGGLPNGILDFESQQSDISAENDLGLDRLPDHSEFWRFPRLNGTNAPVWERLIYGDTRLDDSRDHVLGGWRHDPGRDNWRIYDHNNHQNRRFVNGTQGNDRVDSEDIGNNGWRRADSAFFRYIINLEDIESSPFFAGFGVNPNNDGWVRIRLPIGFVPDSVRTNWGSENYQEPAAGFWLENVGWRSIRHVRMLWTEMATNVNAQADSLEFEGIQFVGNLWQEQVYDSVQGGTGKTTGLISASILDSRTHIGYTVPSGKNRDTINGEQAVDYTLRLEIKDLPAQSPTPRSVFVNRRFEASQAMNLSNYRAIRFWAMDSLGSINNINATADSSSWFILRLGTDSLTFYEFRTRRLTQDWGPGFSIELDDFTDLKLAWFNRRGERHVGIDTTKEINGNYIRVFTETRIPPNLSNITWIAFGVQNSSGSVKSYDIRINGFRATGISERSGWAARASMRFRWSDFISNSFDFRYQDAGFRMMNDDILSDSRTQLSSGASGDIRLDRFFPDRHGLHIPLGGEIRATIERPEIRPNSDISLRNERGEADNLRDMGGDFARFITGSSERGNTTLSEEYEMRGRSRTAFTGFRKSRRSERVGTRLTADRIDVNYSMTFRDSLARMGRMPEDERELIRRPDFDDRFHAEIITSQRHAMDVTYDFSPSQEVMQVLSWQPFSQNTSSTLSRNIKNMSFNLLPERVVFRLFDVEYNWHERYSSIRDVMDTTDAGLYVISTRPTEEVRMRHSLNITHRPIHPFVSINYNIGINRNFDRFIRDWDNSGVSNFAREAVLSLDREFGPYNVLFSEHGRDQGIQLSLTPEITRWLRISSNSTGNYVQNMEFDNDSTFMRTNITSGFTVNTQLFTRRLFEDISRRAREREGFSNAMSSIASGFETFGFESVNFNYGASMNLTNHRLDMEYLDHRLDRHTGRFMLYSFGVFNRSLGDFITGNMDDAGAFGGVQNRNDWWDENATQGNAADTRRTSQNYTVSTAMRIPQPVEISVNTISLGWRREYNITPIPERFDTTITYPDLRFGLSSSAFEQLEVVNQNFSTFRVDWGYSFRRTERISGVKDVRLEENSTIAWGFTPLLRTNLRLRRIGLGFTYQLDLGFDTTHTRESNNDNLWSRELTQLTERKTTQNTWNASYHVPGRRGRTMRIFRDQIIEINGDMDYSLSIRYTKVSHDNPILQQRTGEDQRYDDISVSISPQMTYRLTRNVDARVFYNLVRNIRGRSENLSHNTNFGMEVTISF